MNQLGLPYTSIPEMMRSQAREISNKNAFGYKKNGEYTFLSYQQFYQRVLLIARSLKRLELEKGARVAILSENRIEWVLSDMGALCAGLVTVPIYPSNTPEQVNYILNDSKSDVLFCSTADQYEKITNFSKKIKLKKIITYEEVRPHDNFETSFFNDFANVKDTLKDSEISEIESSYSDIKSEDLVTLIYTSGTTGDPKGVMLSHQNIIYDAYYGIKKVEVLEDSDVMLSFLPLSHAFERSIGYYLPLMRGLLVCYAESIDTLLDDIQKVNPTAMIGVPRLFEKVYAKIQDAINKMPSAKKKLVNWALGVGNEFVQRKYIRKESLGFIGMQYKLAQKLVFGKMKEKFGTRARFFVSGGAPLDRQIIEFFWAIGLPILEGFGLTETSPAIVFNTFDKLRFGSVGTLFEHMEVRVADDGELEFKGPAIMQGYYKNKKASEEALDGEWFKTGDIGHVDDEGFVFITDRKKEIIVTAGGKNIAPQPMENTLKMDPFIGQAIVVGDKQPYLIALIVPDFEQLNSYAKENHIQFSSNEELVKHPSIRELMDKRRHEINKIWPSYQTIKKFGLIGEEFTVESGELTPTLKLKRRIIHENHKETINNLYNS